MQKKQGFTLIELLVVLAIMGILLSVVGVQTGRVLQQSKQTRIDAELVELLTAGEEFHLENPQVEAHSQETLLGAGCLDTALKSPIQGYRYEIEVSANQVKVSLEKGGQVYEQGTYRAEKISTRLYLD